MAITLVEASKVSTDPLRSGIIEKFARSSPVLLAADFQDVGGLAYRYTEEGALPGVGFRGINQAFTEETGILNPQVESLAIFGGDADTDVALVKTQPTNNIGDLRATYDGMKVKSMAGFLTLKFFKGDNTSDPTEFDGMERRLTGSQLIDAGATSGGDVLTLAKLDELLDAVDKVGDGTETGRTWLYMNRTMRRKVNTLIRAAGQARETVSGDFGIQFDAYAGIPIGVIEEDNAGNPIFPFTEANPGGGVAASTSIYAVTWSADEYTSLLEAGSISVRDLGEISEKPVYRTRIEWYLSPAIFNKRGAARLQGIKDA